MTATTTATDLLHDEGWLGAANLLQGLSSEALLEAREDETDEQDAARRKLANLLAQAMAAAEAYARLTGE